MTFDPNKIVEPVKEKKGRYVELWCMID
jgi:hypothetical protein